MSALKKAKVHLFSGFLGTGKTTALRHLMAQKNRHCIFLIDDFASELDESKRALLAERLQHSGSQVFVTAISQDQLQQMQPSQQRVFHVENGVIR